jgi:hypothetical protein
VRVVVRTTAANAKEDVERAVEQALRVQYKEMMGPLGPPVAAKVAEIMGQKAEEVVVEAEKKGEGPFTCVIMPGRRNVPPPSGIITKEDWSTVNFYEDPGIKSILAEFESFKREGEVIAYAEYYYFDPSSVGAGIAACNTQREGGPGTGPFWPFMEERGLKFDRIIIFTHAKRSLGPGRSARDYPLGGPNIYSGITPDRVYREVGPYLTEGGELYIIACGQWQAEWEGYAGYLGTNFFVTVWPGEGRLADVGEIIDLINKK